MTRGRLKKVVYQDLFNPSESFEAPNKLLWGMEVHNWNMKQFIEANIIKCRCKHPQYSGTGGFCTYRTCKHSEEDHF